MLIDALKQGQACFGRDERVGIGRSIAASAADAAGKAGADGEE